MPTWSLTLGPGWWRVLGVLGQVHTPALLGSWRPACTHWTRVNRELTSRAEEQAEQRNKQTGWSWAPYISLSQGMSFCFFWFSLGPKRSKVIKSSSSYLSKKVFVPGPRFDPDQALSGGRGSQDHKSSKKRTERDCSKSQNQLKMSWEGKQDQKSTRSDRLSLKSLIFKPKQC